MESIKYKVEKNMLILEEETEGLKVFSNSKQSKFPIKVVWVNKETAYLFLPESKEENFAIVKSKNEKARAEIISEKEIQKLVDLLDERNKNSI